MKCLTPELIERLARDAVEPGDARELWRHIESCHGCRRRLEVARANEEAVRKLEAPLVSTLLEQTETSPSPDAQADGESAFDGPPSGEWSAAYEIAREISRGGQGVVYRAVQKSTKRPVAIKLMHGEYLGNPRVIARFQREVSILAQLSHPNIVTIHDSGLTTGSFYYVMDYIAGEPLDASKLRRTSTVQDALALFAKICEAVAAAHLHGIVHRDLKPSNILVDDAGEPHILDFGLAKMIADTPDSRFGARGLTITGEFFGSLPWSSPEQAEGIPRKIGLSTDVYALGVILYEMLTGRFPYDVGGGVREALENIVSAEPVRPSAIQRAVDDDVETIVSKCLAKEPERRYRSAGELARDVRLYLADAPIEAKRDSTWYVLRKTVTRTLQRNYRSASWALVILAVSLLTAMFCVGQTRWLAPGSENRGVILVAFQPSTLDAIRDGRAGADLDGLALENRKSWRLLYGEILETLAQASPRAVVWDGFFPDCHAEYDARLLRGFEALWSGGVPVVIGGRDFDVNGEPLGCEHILEAAHACGAMHGVAPHAAAHEFFVPICIRRGLAAPIPTLPVAGFAAARFPGCELDLRLEGERVLACYRRRHHADGEPAWRSEVDEFPIAMRERDRAAHILGSDDEVVCAKVRHATPGEWAGRVVPLEDVLTASRRQLETWFAGRVVVYGQMLPGKDVHGTLHGAEVHGCQVQAQALDELLDRAYLRRFSRWGVVLRVFLWCTLAGIIARFVPIGPLSALRFVKLICLGFCALGMVIGLVCVAWMSSRWVVEAAIGSCAILVAGSLAHLAKVCWQPGRASRLDDSHGTRTTFARASAESG